MLLPFHRLILILLLCGFVPYASRGADLNQMGTLGGGTYSSGSKVSDNGVVTGVGDSSNGGSEAFRWTLSGGMNGLGALDPANFYSISYGLSGDGTLLVGDSYSTSMSPEGFYWTSGGGLTGLGNISGGSGSQSSAYSVSYDGNTIVGLVSPNSGTNFAAYWTAGGGWTSMGDFTGGGNSLSRDVSSNGTVIVGYGTSASEQRAFRWTSGGGMVDLGLIDGLSGISDAYGVSAGGGVVVGVSSSTSGDQAFRWTTGGGMSGLGDLAGGSFYSQANDVSADGQIVVGWGNTGNGQEAFVWDQVYGMRRFQDVLTNYGISMAGIDLIPDASGISPDGTRITGTLSSSGNGIAYQVDLGSSLELTGQTLDPVNGILNLRAGETLSGIGVVNGFMRANGNIISNGTTQTLVLTNGVQGVGNMIKSGSGSLVLQGGSISTGGLIVSNGSVSLTDTTMTNSFSAVSVESAASFDAQGMLTSETVIKSNGLFSINGSSSGSLTNNGSLSLETGSIFSLSPDDYVKITGAFTNKTSFSIPDDASGGGALMEIDSFNAAPGSLIIWDFSASPSYGYYGGMRTAIANGNIFSPYLNTAIQLNPSLTPQGFYLSTYQDATYYYLVTVPEPSGMGQIALGLIFISGLFLMRRCRGYIKRFWCDYFQKNHSILNVLFMFIFCLGLPAKVLAKTNYLENPNDLGLIVRASKAGDVVIVPDAVYSNAGLFTMSNSSVIIQSQSAGMTVLKGATGIQLSGSSNVLAGINFYETGRNTNTGLKPLVLLNAQNTIVSNSYFYQAGFSNNPFGHIVDLINNSYSNQITGNVFDGSYSMSVGITTGTTPANFTSTNNIIAQNSFKNILDVNTLHGTNNGMECIQLGQNSTSIYETVSLYTTVVSNHFYNVTGDRGEIISIKSSDNIIAQNTFSNNNSGIVIRDGDRNAVVGNFFINTNNANTSSHGVDVIGASNLVANNYFEGLETPAIIMRAWNTNFMSGNNARRATFDNDIINNTIIGDVTSSIRSEGTNATMNLGSSNTFYANNLIYQTANRAFTNNLGHTYTAQSNIIVLTGTANAGNINSGFLTNINVEMAKVDGFYRPTNSAAQGMGVAFAGVTNDMDGQTRANPPAVGADEGVATGSTLAPPAYLEMNDVGTTWTPQTVAPVAASGVVITDGLYKQNILAWTDNSSNEVGFRIERSDAGGAWQTLGSVGHNQTNFTDNKNLIIGTNYQYRIIAVNEVGESSAVNSTTLAKAAGGISNTLVADDFNDNIRVNTKADAQDVTWYNVGGDTLDTTNIATLGGSPALIWSKNYSTSNGANAGMIGYFDKQTLEEGDTLRMSFSVLATSLTNQSRGFRFGLLDSLETQVTDDSGVNSGNRAYSDDKGYSFHVPLGTATQGSMNFDPGVSSDGIFIGSPGSLIGTNVTMSNFGISQTNTKYDITFDMKNLTNSMIVSINFNGSYSTNMTFSGTNYLNSFDGMAFMWQPNSGGPQAYEFAIDSVRLYFIAAIPEPTIWGQIAVGLTFGLGFLLVRKLCGCNRRL